MKEVEVKKEEPSKKKTTKKIKSQKKTHKNLPLYERFNMRHDKTKKHY